MSKSLSIPCPKCSNRYSSVTDTRTERGKNIHYKRRRRKCSECGNLFTTYETAYNPITIFHGSLGIAAVIANIEAVIAEYKKAIDTQHEM